MTDFRGKQPPSLIAALMKAELYDHPLGEIVLIETHISWVILTGPYAYKIKKPLNLGFLDFSTLEKRAFYCKEELRLNARWAASLYLEVIPITGTEEQPKLAGEGEVIEYAVKMRQFPQEAQLDHLLLAGTLDPAKIDAVAHMVSKFHQKADIATAEVPYGDPEQVYRPMAENFSQIRALISDDEQRRKLTALAQFSQSRFNALFPLLKQRKVTGKIRECHGDLHLRNLAWIQARPVAFDCIEFNPVLRWIDVLSEAAFFYMDLQHRKQAALAQRFINAYLEDCGDYAGLAVFRFYLIYRALVRAKVAAIQAGQAKGREKETKGSEFETYLKLAQTYTKKAAPKLILTRGVSASGKSTVTQALLQEINAIRIRSDVERKRLFGFSGDSDCRNAIGEGLYSSDATLRTYDRLQADAASILDAGYSVIVDAVFSSHDHRAPFQKLAEEKGVPYLILEFRASPSTLRRRIRTRKKGVSDADLSVLESQLSHWESLHENESGYCLSVDTETPLETSDLAKRIQQFPQT